MKRALSTLLVLFLAGAPAISARGEDGALDGLERSIQAGKWNEAAQGARDILRKDPKSTMARIKGAYALFQLGFSNSALVLLSQIKPEEWRSMPEGKDRLAEVVSLLQKKVPMNILPSRMDQVSLETASPFLIDEIRYNKGRVAFEKGHVAEARQVMEAIPQRSRFFAQAHYLLGTMAVKAHDPATAQAEFSKVFLPSVFEQSTEIWHDINTQISSHWGAQVKVAFDGELVNESKRVGELSVLALARVEYGRKDYSLANQYYNRIGPDSRYYPRATLEKVWALLNLKKHSEAESTAAALSLNESSFESFEARPLRALVLTDASRTDEARHDIEEFRRISTQAVKSIEDYRDGNPLTGLPLFLQNELGSDTRLSSLARYQQELQDELTALRAADQKTFPCFREFAASLEPMLAQTKSLQHKLIADHVHQRLADMRSLFLRADLIRVETYLEDREKLRAEFRGMKEVDEQKQLEHDHRLFELMMMAVAGVDAIFKAHPHLSEPRLEFRQSELLWELGNISAIIGQTKQDKKFMSEGEAYKKRSLRTAQDVLKKYPNFPKKDQASFFIGLAQIDLGSINEGLNTLRAYIKDYPKHEHAPDAFRILGDDRFDANDFRGSEAYYKKILEFPESPIVGYALYKIGWAAYNEKDFARTLLGLEKAIVWNNRAGKENQILSLQREAEHDMIKLYAEFGDHRKAREYFQKFLPGEQQPRLEQLAEELSHHGQYEKSSDIYSLLIEMNPSSPKNASFQAEIVYGWQQLHRWPDAVRAADQLAASYKAQLEAPQGEDTAAGKAEKIVREAIMAQLFEYHRRPTPEGAKNVKALNEAYFSVFQKWPGAQQAIYRHAQFLLDQHDERQAAHYFQMHWTLYGPILKEPNREEALRNLISALNQTEQHSKSDTMTPEAADLLKYSAEYVRTYPSSPHVRSIAYIIPTLEFKYGQEANAVVEWQKLFDANSSDDIGKRSFQNLRASYYKSKDWAKTGQWSNDMLARSGSSAIAADLKVIHTESNFLMNDSNPDDVKSAEGFLKLSEETSNADLRNKCLYNAFVRLNKAGHKLEALKVADTLQSKAPKYEGLTSLNGLRAALYQEAGDYERSGPLLDAFLKSPPAGTPKDVIVQATLNAGLINEALGHGDRARSLFDSYLKASPDGKGAADAKRGLERMRAARTPTGHVEDPHWIKLRKLSAGFEKSALPVITNMAKRIEVGAQSLESITKAYLKASNDPEVPADDAFEMYCRVPLFYSSYAQAVLDLKKSKRISDQERAEFSAELDKIVAPINQKAGEMAKVCITKSSANEHVGTYFRAVVERWGWSNSPEAREKLGAVMAKLQARSPWLDGSTSAPTSEAEIIKSHHQNGGTEESWYALAKLRWDRGAHALSRLTAVDALGRFSKSGRLLNALAADESKRNDNVSKLFTAAGDQGSAAAWINLAIYHLKAARIPEAQAALQKAVERQGFRDDPSLESQVKGLL
jgi:tetratricopeptide (TPR) repeat protein